MNNQRPKAIFVGPPAIGSAIEKMRKEWDFIYEVLPSGATRPIQDLNQLQEGFSVETIDRNAQVIIVNDTLFDPNDHNGLFENAIANFSPYSLTLVVSYRPELRNIIMQKVAAKQAELNLDGAFYFVDRTAPNPSIDNALTRFVKESNQKEVSEILLGRSLDTRVEDEITTYEQGAISVYDDQPSGKGEVIAVTSNKGGSGKTTIALSLATFLGHSSESSYREGLEDRPLKVIVVDFDVRDGQVGFLTGRHTPTMLDLINASPLTEEAIKDVIITNDRLKIDLLLAPKLPAYADELTLTFYRDLLRLLRRSYDYIIVDTSVNYLDPLLDKVTYPDADAIIFVCDYVIQALLGMGRFLNSIKKKAELGRGGGEYIDPEKIGIVVNKTLQNTSLSKEMLMKATMGIPILTNIPANPRIAGQASNSQTIDLLMKHPDFTKRFAMLAKEIVGDSYKLSDNVL